MNVTFWSQAERTLLETLTCKVAMLREREARLLWRHVDKDKQVRFCVACERLTAAGLLERYTVNLHRPIEPSSPALRTAAGHDADVDLTVISNQLKDRWNHACRPTNVLVASRRAANLYGSTSRGLPNLLHRNHDALLGEVYVHYLSNAPQIARMWVGEHVLARAGYQVKDPDAFLIRSEGPFRVVESGGSYSRRQLESLVEYARERELELEVW